MSEPERASWREKNRVLVAVYPDEKGTEAVVRRLIDQGYQMDLISVLGQLHTSGDDTLGVYHLNVGDRMKAWGKQGVFWGGLWGMVAGAAGLFMIPGVGVVMAAGYIVEAIAGGAVVGATAMGGAAALSQLAVAYHRAGIPQEKIESLHKAIIEGKYVLMLRGAMSELDQWREVLVSGKPIVIDNLPYSRIIDKA
jgi:uncharacterized membrane protein